MLEAGDLTVTHSSLSVGRVKSASLFRKAHSTRLPKRLTCHFDIMYPDVRSPNIDAVQPAPIGTTNDHIVHFTIRACVHGEMESRRINQRNVVNTKVLDLVQTQDTRAIGVVLKELISITLDSTSRIGAVKLKVRGVFDEDHVFTCSTCAVNGSLEIDRDTSATSEGHPSGESIAASGDIDLAAGFAGCPCGGNGGRIVGGGRCDAALTQCELVHRLWARKYCK